MGPGATLPSDLLLEQNYPNPFNPTTTIRYALPATSQVRLDVFTISGQRVAELVSGVQSAGWHEVTFDASSLTSGVYVYRLETVVSGGFAGGAAGGSSAGAQSGAGVQTGATGQFGGTSILTRKLTLIK